MPEEVYVILDPSPEVRNLLEEQGTDLTDLYEVLQREVPSRLDVMSDPEMPGGSRDVVTVIAVAATLVSSLTRLFCGSSI